MHGYDSNVGKVSRGSQGEIDHKKREEIWLRRCVCVCVIV